MIPSIATFLENGFQRCGNTSFSRNRSYRASRAPGWLHPVHDRTRMPQQSPHRQRYRPSCRKECELRLFQNMHTGFKINDRYIWRNKTLKFFRPVSARPNDDYTRISRVRSVFLDRICKNVQVMEPLSVHFER